MQRQTSTNRRDAPGQDTGRSHGHLSTYLLGGAPGERYRARCKSDSRGCDTHCGGQMSRNWSQQMSRHCTRPHYAPIAMIATSMHSASRFRQPDGNVQACFQLELCGLPLMVPTIARVYGGSLGRARNGESLAEMYFPLFSGKSGSTLRAPPGALPFPQHVPYLYI
jgi:hypothetical protein